MIGRKYVEFETRGVWLTTKGTPGDKRALEVEKRVIRVVTMAIRDPLVPAEAKEELLSEIGQFDTRAGFAGSPYLEEM